MSDYTNTKENLGTVDNLNVVDAAWSRHGPLITGQDLADLYLFGIPLVSAFKDPDTNRPQRLTIPMLDKFIARAVTVLEEEIGIDIFPTQHKEKMPFDKHEYDALGFFKLRKRPVSSIESLTITPASGADLYKIPLEWIETANMASGQINIIPLNVMTAGGGFIISSGASGGALFMSLLSRTGWIPAFWQAIYTTGFPEGKIPSVMNELIGTQATILVLSLLAATYSRSTSHSLGIDSMSQSISTPGPALFDTAITEAKDRKKTLLKKVKNWAGTNMFVSSL